jgi:hypothetical protein
VQDNDHDFHDFDDHDFHDFVHNNDADDAYAGSV